MTLLENVTERYFIETNKQKHHHTTDNNQSIKDYKLNLNEYSLSESEYQKKNKFLSLTDYHNDVIRLASYYEQILKTYGKVELEALAYKISAACHSCESSNLLNSVNFNSPTKFRSKNDTSVDCPYNTETFTASFHPPITYHLEVHLTSSKSIYFNQLSNQSMNCFPSVKHHHHHHFNSSFMNRLSCKVFVGGVPMRGNQVTTWTRDQLHKGLSIFGPVSLVWPKGTIVIPSVIDGRNYNQELCESLLRIGLKRGYCYAVFNDQRSVSLLLSMCYRRTKGFYINLSTLCPDLEKTRFDSLQIIPWDKQDSFYPILPNRNSGNINFHSEEGRVETETRTKVYSIFVGALHGMITARALFTIFNDLFSNVSYAALDIDKYHYPIGSGRVAFNSLEGYLAAIKTNFICIECQLFSKVIQIDPYLEDAMCSKCFSVPGIYFCRHLKCFDYFCPKCWIHYHGSKNTTHKPLRRTLIPNSLKFAKYF
uniref:Putative cytoplasmic polyadenylation element binding protein (Cpeb) n=1 Tax=Schistosoma mansoni TaxID=6183 RepID=A0A3Q0KHE9_SCHMA